MQSIVFLIDYVIIVMGDTMKTLFYIIVYGFLGYLLERMINIIFLARWLDNSVLFLPIQPMYGIGVVLTLIFYNAVLKHRTINHYLKALLLWMSATVFTMISELSSGVLYHRLYGVLLWDYRDTFPVCSLPYICFIPTPIFGVLAAMSVLFIHPWIESFTKLLPKWVIFVTIGVVFIDYIYTYLEVLI